MEKFPLTLDKNSGRLPLRFFTVSSMNASHVTFSCTSNCRRESTSVSTTCGVSNKNRSSALLRFKLNNPVPRCAHSPIAASSRGIATLTWYATWQFQSKIQNKWSWDEELLRVKVLFTWQFRTVCTTIKFAWTLPDFGCYLGVKGNSRRKIKRS